MCSMPWLFFRSAAICCTLYPWGSKKAPVAAVLYGICFHEYSKLLWIGPLHFGKPLAIFESIEYSNARFTCHLVLLLSILETETD
jgi:hypothetical protein